MFITASNRNTKMCLFSFFKQFIGRASGFFCLNLNQLRESHSNTVRAGEEHHSINTGAPQSPLPAAPGHSVRCHYEGRTEAGQDVQRCAGETRFKDKQLCAKVQISPRSRGRPVGSGMAGEVINRKGGAGEGAGSVSEVITAEESSNLQNPPPPWDVRDPNPQRPRAPSAPYSPEALSHRSAQRLQGAAATRAACESHPRAQVKSHRLKKRTRGNRSPQKSPHLTCLRLRYWFTKRVP